MKCTEYNAIELRLKDPISHGSFSVSINSEPAVLKKSGK